MPAVAAAQSGQASNAETVRKSSAKGSSTRAQTSSNARLVAASSRKRAADKDADLENLAVPDTALKTEADLRAACCTQHSTISKLRGEMAQRDRRIAELEGQLRTLEKHFGVNAIANALGAATTRERPLTRSSAKRVA